MSNEAELLRKFQESSIEKLNQAYKDRVDVQNLDGIDVFHEPFTHCSISNLITDESFLKKLKKQVLDLKFKKKNNDLYKFHQTNELKNSKASEITKFKNVLYGKFLDFLKNVTGINLLADKIDMTSSKYEYTDYLLCHDDDIHGEEEGRRIAFIYYLVPEDWCEADGGALDLFKINENYQPVEIVKSLVPQANRLSFFEVSDRSYHQVAEVLSKNKTRLSIHGWFHGPVNYRPPRHIEIVQNPRPCLSLDPDTFFEWIDAKYLDPVNQSEIQEKFGESSEIRLDKIFDEKKYNSISDAFKSESINWIQKGPWNRRNYEVADEETLPEIIKDIARILQSDLMAITLSNLTGLVLHPSCKAEKKEKEAEESQPCTSSSLQENNDTNDSEPSNKRFKLNDESTCYCEIRRWKQGAYTLITDDDTDMQLKALDAMIFFNSESLKKSFGGNVSYIARDEDDELLSVFPEDNCLALVYRDTETLRFTKYVNSKFKANFLYEISVVYYE